MTIIELKGITKIYDGRTVLDIDHYKFDQGKIYALVGPNGSGKTTLFRIIALLEEPTTGVLTIDGSKISTFDSHIIRKKIVLVHQEPLMFDTSVKKNVSLGLSYRGVPRKEAAVRIKKSLEMVGMPNFSRRHARHLSGGETKRVAIARGLALSPEIILLDEPTANVDEKNIGMIEEIIISLKKSNKTTVIFSTHNIKQAYHLADEVLTLMDGMPRTEPVRNFFSGSVEMAGDEPIFNTGVIKIKLPAFNDKAQYISIDPSEIIISKKRISSSARNQFPGKIIELKMNGEVIGLSIDAGQVFHVDVTRRSFFEMGLNIGEKVFVAFKATSIVLY